VHVVQRVNAAIICEKIILAFMAADMASPSLPPCQANKEREFKRNFLHGLTQYFYQIKLMKFHENG
jgi:hypothetical protein